MSYKRSKETKRRLKKLYDETWHSYGRGAWYDEFRNRYIRYTAVSPSTGKYFRRRTNKKIRKKKIYLPMVDNIVKNLIIGVSFPNYRFTKEKN